MKNKQGIFIAGVIIVIGFLLYLILKPDKPKPEDSVNVKSTVSKKVMPTHYNVYIENSGSMKGYFFKNSGASTLLKEYFDRIDESKEDSDKITFNYINTSVSRINTTKDGWWNGIYDNCNVQYSPIDNVLDQVLKKTNATNVSLVFSDYCFTSPDGNFATAQSGITKLITKAIKRFGKDFTISILKFDLQFDGIYYPTNVKYKGKHPLYLWILGSAEKVKRVSQLQINSISKSYSLSLQSTAEITPSIQTEHKRMTNGSDILVKYWKPDRRTNKYVVDMDVDFSNVVLPHDSLVKIGNYRIDPRGYRITSIKKKSNEGSIYTITVETNAPSPGQLNIYYPLVCPQWVETSNYEKDDVPPADKTLGFKSLVDGVYYAFHNNQKNRFEITIPLK